MSGKGGQQDSIVLEDLLAGNHQFLKKLDFFLYSEEGESRPRSCIVISNPFGGKGEARRMYLRTLLPFLACASIDIQYIGPLFTIIFL